MKQRRRVLAGLTALAVVAIGLIGGTSAMADEGDGPTLTVPETIRAGQQLWISGTECYSFPGQPQATVLVSVNGETNTTYPETWPEAENYGEWTDVTPAMGPGTVTVTATCDSYYGSFSYEPATVEVVDDATVTVSPPFTQAGATVTLAGEGWSLACDCMPGPIVLILTQGSTTWPLGAADHEGGWVNNGLGFSLEVTLPSDLAPGQYQVEAQQGGYHHAVTPLTIFGDEPVTASAAVDPTSVQAGGTVDVTGTGFLSEENVRIELHSTPVVLSTVVAGALGDVSTTVTIPAGTASGAHQIVLIGEESGRTASAALTVTDPTLGSAGGADGAAAGKGGAGSGTLARTGGTPQVGLLAGAAISLALGAALVWARRRSVQS